LDLDLDAEFTIDGGPILHGVAFLGIEPRPFYWGRLVKADICYMD